MREIYEIRVQERFADRLFADNEGVRLGDSVRKVLLPSDDPRICQVKDIDSHTRAVEGTYFFSYAAIRRRYTKRELEAAELFHLMITAVFEPEGESCGTIYDESTACPHCGAGRTQESDLRLDLRKTPKNKDIARTIADEWIVSQRLAELMIDAGLTGFRLHRVRHKASYEDDPIDLSLVPTGRKILQMARAAGAPHPSGEFWIWLNRRENRPLSDQVRQEYAAMKRQRSRRRGKLPPVWYQLVPTSRPVEIASQTRAGIDPFNEDPEGKHVCPLGHVIGLNLLSEVWVHRHSYDGSDFAVTKQMVGIRSGVLTPRPLLLISPRFWRLLKEHNIKGYRVEVARVV